MTSTPKDNPYLAHRHPTERAANGTPSSKEPLYGFLPRKVSADAVRGAMVCLLDVIEAA